jgi:hypothetical protein
MDFMQKLAGFLQPFQWENNYPERYVYRIEKTEKRALKIKPKRKNP